MVKTTSLQVELRTGKTKDPSAYILTELVIVGEQDDIAVQIVVSATALTKAARKIQPTGRMGIRRKL